MGSKNCMDCLPKLQIPLILTPLLLNLYLLILRSMCQPLISCLSCNNSSCWSFWRFLLPVDLYPPPSCRVTLEADFPGREVRWLEAESTQSWLLNLDSKEVARLDRREGRPTSLLTSGFPLGRCLSLHPSLPLLSLSQGHTLAVYDLRRLDSPLHTAQHCLQDQDTQSPRACCNTSFSGCSWSPSGALLAGCQSTGVYSKSSRQAVAVWRFSQAEGIVSEPSMLNG